MECKIEAVIVHFDKKKRDTLNQNEKKYENITIWHQCNTLCREHDGKI